MVTFNQYKSNYLIVFAYSHRFRNIHIEKIVTLKISVKDGGGIRWQIGDFLSDGDSYVWSLSHLLQDIRKSR